LRQLILQDSKLCETQEKLYTSTAIKFPERIAYKKHETFNLLSSWRVQV